MVFLVFLTAWAGGVVWYTIQHEASWLWVYLVGAIWCIGLIWYLCVTAPYEDDL